jgi:glutathione S-transferase
MATPIIHGPSFSTYARTVRLTCEEKGVPYELAEVDLAGAKQPAHLARQPFGKVPAFEHDGLALYETSAIARYVDRVFPGPKLQPEDPRQCARMDQIVGIVDSYAYPAIIGKIVIQRLIMPMMGKTPDEAAIQDGLPNARLALAEIERLMGGKFLVDDRLSLADLYLAPVHAYLTLTPEAQSLLAPHRKLQQWWEGMAARDSMKKTEPKFG